MWSEILTIYEHRSQTLSSFTFLSLEWHIINQQSKKTSCSWFMVTKPVKSWSPSTCNPGSNSWSCLPLTNTAKSIFNLTAPNTCLQHVSNPERKRGQSTCQSTSRLTTEEQQHKYDQCVLLELETIKHREYSRANTVNILGLERWVAKHEEAKFLVTRGRAANWRLNLVA